MTRKLNGLPPIIGKMPKTLIRPLADLARCKTSAEAITVLDTIAKKWLPRVAEYTANRTFYRPAIVRTALMTAGLKNLKRDLGEGRTAEIIANYFDANEKLLQERYHHATQPGFNAFLDGLQRFEDFGKLHCCGDQARH